MKRNKPFLLAVLVPALALCSCYHEFPAGGGGGGGTSTANVSMTMVSDTLPTNLGIVSYIVTVNSVQLTSSTGTQTSLALNGGKGITVDLARLQSDSAFLGTVPSVPIGALTSITLSFGTTAKLAFYNGTGAAITNLTPNCPASAVCAASFTVVGTPAITTTQTVAANTGIGIDFNLANSLVLTGTSLAINLSNSGNTNVVSSFALPRTNSNLLAGQLDTIEDFTGVVTLASPGVTIASATVDGRGSIAAASLSGTTVYDQDPTQNLCPGGTNTLGACVTSNGAASMDAILNTDGSFTVQEIEPLLPNPVVDTVEGIVVLNPNNGTQFSIITTDIIPAPTSVLGSLSLGDPLTVNLNNPNPFYVDTKGLAVGGALGNFQGMTDTTAIHLGQSVAVHVTSFTAANGNTPASCQTNSATLRWSRLTAMVNTAGTPEFNIIAVPGYFGFASTFTFNVQTYAGAQGTDGFTNFDGATSGSALTPSQPVAMRALFLENPGNSFDPPFYAAKVRQQ